MTLPVAIALGLVALVWVLALVPERDPLGEANAAIRRRRR